VVQGRVYIVAAAHDNVYRGDGMVFGVRTGASEDGEAAAAVARMVAVTSTVCLCMLQPTRQ
jgi:hypothetical protein